jgi:hypothetical protein
VIIDPYKRNPLPPEVAILDRSGNVRGESGSHELESLEKGVRVWADYDTVNLLVNEGHGEAICWNGEAIHWRHRNFPEDDASDDGWKPRRSDVHVIKLPFPDEPGRALSGLARWRDWLASYGAAPTGTMGSASWSLLRSTLEGELRTGEPFRNAPPLRLTVGGRQQLGPGGEGIYTGRLEQWDIPAAYAETLARLPYGGSWHTQSEMVEAGAGRRSLDWWSDDGRPVFVRAQVKIPDLPFGPLPRRPRGRSDPFLKLGLGCPYPVETTLQGFWTLQELLAAETAGCRILRVLEVWGHFAGGRRPFEPWWSAVREGRELHGFPGQLAKMTGNALWGRFCMDGRLGQRTIRSRGAKRLRSRPLVFRGGQPPAHDLAETVSGRVRARLYEAMVETGESLISAHTDGLWKRRDGEPIEGWRRKQRASRIELLTPQTLRYWPLPSGDPVSVVAGEPASTAEAAFEKQWAAAGYNEDSQVRRMVA